MKSEMSMLLLWYILFVIPTESRLSFVFDTSDTTLRQQLVKEAIGLININTNSMRNIQNYSVYLPEFDGRDNYYVYERFLASSLPGGIDDHLRWRRSYQKSRQLIRRVVYAMVIAINASDNNSTQMYLFNLKEKHENFKHHPCTKGRSFRREFCLTLDEMSDDEWTTWPDMKTMYKTVTIKKSDEISKCSSIQLLPKIFVLRSSSADIIQPTHWIRLDQRLRIIQPDMKQILDRVSRLQRNSPKIISEKESFLWNQHSEYDEQLESTNKTIVISALWSFYNVPVDKLSEMLDSLDRFRENFLQNFSGSLEEFTTILNADRSQLTSEYGFQARDVIINSLRSACGNKYNSGALTIYIDAVVIDSGRRILLWDNDYNGSADSSETLDLSEIVRVINSCSRRKIKIITTQKISKEWSKLTPQSSFSLFLETDLRIFDVKQVTRRRYPQNLWEEKIFSWSSYPHQYFMENKKVHRDYQRFQRSLSLSRQRQKRFA